MDGDYELCPSDSEVKALGQKGYAIGKKIGQGSYATVYLADFRQKNATKKIILACKIVDHMNVPSEFYSKFFAREIEILKILTHPSIIPLHSIMQRGSKVFIFMRYAENGDLLNYIKATGPIPEEQCKKWFRQLTSAINYLHSQNIAHRDLKCENVLLSQRYNIKLTDFGFARYCVDQAGHRILSRTYCGSAAYVAPEIISGTPYNPKMADIWSLGIVLYIMLNAHMPFDDSSLPKLLRCQILRKWTFRKKVREHTSPLCRSIVRQILEPDVTRRLRLEGILHHKWLQQPQREVTATGDQTPQQQATKPKASFFGWLSDGL